MMLSRSGWLSHLSLGVAKLSRSSSTSYTKPWLGSRNQVSKREQLLNTENLVSTMSSERLTTPPPQLQDGNSGAKSPLTPEQTRRMEINRLKAKALREQREAEAAAALERSENSVAGQKRSFATFAQTPATVRDGRTDSVAPDRPLEAARNFAKYVEYDFSKMTDTK